MLYHHLGRAAPAELAALLSDFHVLFFIATVGIAESADHDQMLVAARLAKTDPAAAAAAAASLHAPPGCA